MTQTINVGTVANDGTGDSLRQAFIKVNDNTTELVASIALKEDSANKGVANGYAALNEFGVVPPEQLSVNGIAYLADVPQTFLGQLTLSKATENTLGNATTGGVTTGGGMGIGGNLTVTGDVQVKGGGIIVEGSPIVSAHTIGNNVSLFATTTGTISIGANGSTVALGDDLTVAGTINKVTLTQPATSATITIADTKTLSVTDNATVSGTNTGDQNFSTIQHAPTHIIGTPDVGIDLDDTFDVLGSAGILRGGKLTDNGDGTVDVESCACAIRHAAKITSITRVGQIATAVTEEPHDYDDGEIVFVNGADQADYNGFFTATVIDATTFTYIVNDAPVTPATGTLLFTTADHHELYIAEVPAATNLALTNNATNYVYVSYNDGAPEYRVTTDGSTIAELARVLIWTIARIGTDLHTIDNRGSNVDGIRKFNKKAKDTDNFKVSLGGSVLSATGTRNIALSAGVFWSGITRIPHNSFDTSASDTFTTAYQTNGVWTYTSGQTQINNTQYNNTATGLATLSDGSYGVHWVYLLTCQVPSLMVVYGTSDYTSKSSARAAQEPAKNAVLAGVATLVGRIIIQKNASSFTDTSSAFQKIFPQTNLALDGLSDVSITTTPALSDSLIWNGVAWTNAAVSTSSAGAGIAFYNATPILINTGTNNANLVGSLARTPITTTEQTTTTSLASNTVLVAAWLYDTALGRTSIDAGTWQFNTYAGVNSTAGGRITTVTRNVCQVIPGTGTVTVTGAGTTRTATVSGATPFVAGDANASVTNCSYLQTPQGIYQISAYTSSTIVSIIVPTTYVNETSVSYSKWFKLFGATSAAITAITPTYSANAFTSVQAAFPIAVTDKLGFITFGTSNNTTTLTTVYNGTTNNTHVVTPLATLHGDISGLQGGTGSGPTAQYYHLTSAEYTGTGSGAFVRQTSPSLTTPTLGVATATSINKVAITTPATGSTLTIADGKTLTANNTLTLNGTDGSSVAFGTGGTVVYQASSSLGTAVGQAITVDVNTVITNAELTTTSTSVDQVIATLAGATYRSAEVVIQAVDATATKYQIVKLLAIHDGSAAQHVEYGNLAITGNVGSFNVDYSGGNMRILTTPTTTNSSVFRATIIATKAA